MVAYGLMLLTIVAGIGIALILRHNSRDATMARDEKRQREHREAKFLEK